MEVQVGKDAPVKMLLGAFPDSKKWLGKMITATGAKTAFELVNGIGCLCSVDITCSS